MEITSKLRGSFVRQVVLCRDYCKVDFSGRPAGRSFVMRLLATQRRQVFLHHGTVALMLHVEKMSSNRLGQCSAAAAAAERGKLSYLLCFPPTRYEARFSIIIIIIIQEHGHFHNTMPAGTFLCKSPGGWKTNVLSSEISLNRT